MLKKRLPHFLSLVTIGVVALTGFIFLAPWHWIPDLFTHFRLPYIIGFTAILLITLFQKRWKYALSIGICLLIQLFAVAPHYFPTYRDQRESTGPALKVMSSNVLYSNTQHQEIIDSIKQEDPDLVFLMEIYPRWAKPLRDLAKSYPHQVFNYHYGIVFLSKLPITSHKFIEPSPEDTAFLVADLTWEEKDLRFFGAHTFTPLNGKWAKARNTVLEEIKTQSLATAETHLIVGDLNCSAFSPHFHTLQKGLRDSARGRGYSATWQRNNPILAIPIDHILTTEDLVCIDFQIGPKDGSDHSPLIGTYRRAR